MRDKSMGEFNCNFLDLPTDKDPSPAKYASYFQQYRPSDWKRGSGGGSFVYFDECGDQYDLTIAEHPDYGIGLMYGEGKRSGGGAWVSVSQPDLLSQFVEACDQFLMPAGAFLDPMTAWLAVKDFIAQPSKRSESVRWVSCNELKWPEP